MKKLIIPLFFVFGLVSNTVAQKASMDDLDFLVGYWIGDGFGGISEEVWTPVANGKMSGIYKHRTDEATTFMEFLDISEVNDTIKLRLKHFNPDMTGWEEKDDYVTFTLESLAPNKAVFKGLTYERITSDSLRVSLKLRQKDGSVNTEIFNFKKTNL